MEHLNECAEVFLKNQKKLFDEEVVADIDEAKEFLEENFAAYCKDLKELRQLLDDEGLDATELSDDELEEQLEVFKLDDGGYFFLQC